MPKQGCDRHDLDAQPPLLPHSTDFWFPCTIPCVRCWQALLRMHEDIIPHLANPLMLADLLTGALDSGGLVGMLALHAIFVLVTQHGLEYPEFYARLYQLLQPSAFFVSFPQSLLPSQSPRNNDLVVTAYSPATQLGSKT